MQRITISIDNPLADEFDALIARNGYENRSEAFRDLLRARLDQHRKATAGIAHCIATVSYVFNYHERELASRLASALHEHHDICLSSQRIPLDHDNALETVVLRGRYPMICEFADALVAMKGVRHGNVHIVPVDMVKTGKTALHSHASPGHFHLHPKS